MRKNSLNLCVLIVTFFVFGSASSANKASAERCVFVTAGSPDANHRDEIDHYRSIIPAEVTTSPGAFGANNQSKSVPAFLGFRPKGAEMNHPVTLKKGEVMNIGYWLIGSKISFLASPSGKNKIYVRVVGYEMIGGEPTLAIRFEGNDSGFQFKGKWAQFKEQIKSGSVLTLTPGFLSNLNQCPVLEPLEGQQTILADVPNASVGENDYVIAPDSLQTEKDFDSVNRAIANQIWRSNAGQSYASLRKRQRQIDFIMAIQAQDKLAPELQQWEGVKARLRSSIKDVMNIVSEFTDLLHVQERLHHESRSRVSQQLQADIKANEILLAQVKKRFGEQVADYSAVRNALVLIMESRFISETTKVKLRGIITNMEQTTFGVAPRHQLVMYLAKKHPEVEQARLETELRDEQRVLKRRYIGALLSVVFGPDSNPPVWWSRIFGSSGSQVFMLLKGEAIDEYHRTMLLHNLIVLRFNIALDEPIYDFLESRWSTTSLTLNGRPKLSLGEQLKELKDASSEEQLAKQQVVLDRVRKIDYLIDSVFDLVKREGNIDPLIVLYRLAEDDEPLRWLAEEMELRVKELDVILGKNFSKQLAEAKPKAEKLNKEVGPLTLSRNQSRLMLTPQRVRRIGVAALSVIVAYTSGDYAGVLPGPSEVGSQISSFGQTVTDYFGYAFDRVASVFETNGTQAERDAFQAIVGDGVVTEGECMTCPTTPESTVLH